MRVKGVEDRSDAGQGDEALGEVAGGSAVNHLVELPPAPDPDPYQDPLALAVVEEVFERGRQASAPGLIARSGVPASEFHQRHDTLEDCALDAYERFIASFKRRVGGAFNAGSDWRDSLRAAAYETADFMEESPALVGFGMTGVLEMNNELARVRREEVFVFCADLIDRGRTEPSEIEADEAAAMFAIGSIMQLLTFRLQSGGPIEPHAIVPEMMYAVVRAYKGEAAAQEELEMPRPGSATLGRTELEGTPCRRRPAIPRAAAPIGTPTRAATRRRPSKG
jgi:hypothetical protein